LNTPYRCFPAKPFHGLSSQIDRLTWAASHASNTPNDITDFSKPLGYPCGHGRREPALIGAGYGPCTTLGRPLASPGFAGCQPATA
jgi:hypothetical protein